MSNVKLLGLIIAFLFTSNIYAQDVQNVIVLWDVTWSMKGKTATGTQGKPIIDLSKKIWEETKVVLDQTLSNIATNGTVNVKIIPFEDPSNINGFNHEVKVVKSLDKDELTDLRIWLKEYDGSPWDQPSNTNLCMVLDQTYKELEVLQNENASISRKTKTTVMLFSDGNQTATDPNYSSNCLDDLFARYCNWVQQIPSGDAIHDMFVIELKNMNIDRNSLVQFPNCIKIIGPDPQCKFTNTVILTLPQSSLKMDMQDFDSKNSQIEILFEESIGRLPDDFTFDITSSNNRFEIESIVSNGPSIQIKFNELELSGGEMINTRLTFKGRTDKPCYKFEVDSYEFYLQKQQYKKILIGDMNPIEKP